MTVEATITMGLQEYEERRIELEDLRDEVEELRNRVRDQEADLERLKYDTSTRTFWGIEHRDGEITGYSLQDAKSIVKYNSDVHLVFCTTTGWERYVDGSDTPQSRLL